MAPAATTMPATGYAPEFQQTGLGMKSRYERLPSHLANLFDAVAESANENAFLNQTARRALKGETLDQQDEADGARKAKTLAEFMNEASQQDEISFANSVADLKDAIRSRPGAPRVIQPQAPGIGQVLASVLGAALDPKHAAEIASLPGMESQRQQQVDQQMADRQYQASVDQQRANVDAAKVGFDVSRAKLEDSRQLGSANYTAQQQELARIREEKRYAQTQRQDFAEKLIGKRVKTPGDLAQLQAAAKVAGYELSPEFLDQAKTDIEEEKQFAAARKRLDTLTSSLRSSTDQQSRTSIRAEIVSLAQTIPDAFPNPDQLIADYGGVAMPTAQEKYTEARITGQKVVDLLNQAKIKLTGALTSKIQRLTPLEAEQYAARVDLLTAQYGVAQAQAAQIAIENQWLPAEKQAGLAKAEAAIASGVGGEGKLSDVKAGYQVVDDEIKELRDELKLNRETLNEPFADDSTKAEAKKRIPEIERELAAKKKDRDRFGSVIKSWSASSQTRSTNTAPRFRAGTPPPPYGTPEYRAWLNGLERLPGAPGDGSTKRPRRDPATRTGGAPGVKINPKGTTETVYKGQTYKITPKK